MAALLNDTLVAVLVVEMVDWWDDGKADVTVGLLAGRIDPMF